MCSLSPFFPYVFHLCFPCFHLADCVSVFFALCTCLFLLVLFFLPFFLFSHVFVFVFLFVSMFSHFFGEGGFSNAFCFLIVVSMFSSFRCLRVCFCWLHRFCCSPCLCLLLVSVFSLFLSFFSHLCFGVVSFLGGRSGETRKEAELSLSFWFCPCFVFVFFLFLVLFFFWSRRGGGVEVVSFFSLSVVIVFWCSPFLFCLSLFLS